jgi:hypothetical protein
LNTPVWIGLSTEEIMSHKHAAQAGKVRASVHTAEHAGSYLWAITLLDMQENDVRRVLLSDDTFATPAAAKDAGEAALKGMSQDH